MLRFVVLVQTIDQLEILLDASKTLGLTPELGSEPLQLPSPAPRKSTKRAAKKGKRRSGRMAVKMGKGVEGGDQLKRAYAVLIEQFGQRTFEKREVAPFLKTKLRLSHRPTAAVGLLLDRGGLVPA